MSKRPVVSTAAGPSTRPIDEALRGSAALASLLARVRESRALLAALGPVLPGALAAQIEPGPLDEAGWSLLCANASVAAKVRQLVPSIEQCLRDDGRPVESIRIKVQQR